MSFQPDSPGHTESYSSSEVAGDLFAGRFKLREKLGEGGMGRVYVADQLHPVQRRVAIKVLKAGLDGASGLARFEQERQALALMDHPNIAKVFDGGTDEHGRPFLVMELVKGIPITTYCDQEKLTLKERLELLVPVRQAVQHAHQKGIIHRDLKPSNLLIALYDGKPVPKVIDFGVAKATGQRFAEHTIYTQAGTIVGTLEYMAPEQAELNNLDIDTRADIYSLGVLLYELLTGGPPFTREQLSGVGYSEMLRLLKEVEPPRPSTRLSDSGELPALAARRKLEPKRLTRLVRGDLDWIVLKCLEKERARRYDTANGLAMDLQRYLHDEPVLAGAPGTGYRLRKFVRRHRGPVLAAGLVLLALLGGIVGTASGLIQADRARRDAENAQQKEFRQREAAQAKEKEARDAAAEARAVLEFFQEKVLAAGRPEGEHGGLGKDVTLRKALDVARAEVSTTFKDRPVVEASVLRVLGDTYWYLGEREETIPMFERALALREKHLEANHPDTLSSMQDLAYVYCYTDRVDRGLPLFERAVALKEARLGADHADTIYCMRDLGWCYVNFTEKFEQAIRHFERVLELQQARGRSQHPDTLGSMSGLGSAHVYLGNLDQGIELIKRAMELQKANLGPRSPDTLAAMLDLATAYDMAGKYEQALQLYETVFNLRKATLGPKHPQTLMSMAGLGRSLLVAHRLSEAEPLVRECLAIRQKESPGAWRTFSTQSLLGGTLLAQRKYAEAEPLLLQGYQGMKDRRAKIYPNEVKQGWFREALERLVQLYEATGKPAEAAKWREELESLKKQ